MKTEFDAELESRLLRYTAIDSQSDPASPMSPSTEVQFDMLNLLVEELNGIGASDVRLTDYGTVLATIPATVEHDAPVMGLLAHVDTAPAFNATGVKPRVHRAYDGQPILFPDAPDLRLSPDDYPYLASKEGHDIITASGTTLLGADDKAGVAIIMTVARHLLASPGIPHGPIRLAFTPDEEIGRGVHPDLPADLGADFAFTLDGGAVGEIEYETFSADGATIRIEGVSIHPGTARGKLVNALHLAAKIVQTLPQATMTPETTAGREGFIMVTDMKGSAATAEMHFILRDFERDGLAAKGALLQEVCAAVQSGEPRARITCEITPQYRNMRYWLENDMTPVELAHAATRAAGFEPRSEPIRGGTDGSRLTEMGVPCPNVFTGMQNLHGPLEWISVQDMGAATRTCLILARRAAER
ncbi:peptidase T [Aquicoccus sp.]|uniref:peptidase T n=1 Tax=Aquicoccus sp. TaxID=2055851 RepID=UPI00356AE349